MATTHVTDSSFQADVLDSEKPVLVDFWAEWCGPCRQIAPALDQVAEELADRLTVAKLNIEENPELPSKLGIRGIPTFHVYKGGVKIAEQIGIGQIPNKARLQAWLEGVLENSAASAL